MINPYDVLMAELQKENADIRTDIIKYDAECKQLEREVAILKIKLEKEEKLESQVAEYKQKYEYVEGVNAENMKFCNELQGKVAVLRGALQKSFYAFNKMVEYRVISTEFSFTDLSKICEEALQSTESKAQELLEYAELGRIAAEVASKCEFNWCGSCTWKSLCQKRAELMGEGKK